MGSEPKFTPGPWEIEEMSPGCDGVDIFAPRQDELPVLIASGVWKGDAHIIAAAPCMFDALRSAYELIVLLGRPEVDDTHHAACEAIRAALSKAGGRDAG